MVFGGECERGGVWANAVLTCVCSASIAMGLIKDIPTCQVLCDRMTKEAEGVINNLSSKVVRAKL